MAGYTAAAEDSKDPAVAKYTKMAKVAEDIKDTEMAEYTMVTMVTLSGLFHKKNLCDNKRN